ncbi:MAG: hypothetical protein JKY50_10200 [Oleispira sp.]|nr:hypothetical protein [Oleispira sp.]
MQIPTSAGMLVNSVLPATPTHGGLLSPVGETAGSASFAPIEAVSTIRLSREIPQQRPQPDSAPENNGRADIGSVVNRESSGPGAEAGVSAAEEQGNQAQGDTGQDDRSQQEADQVKDRQQQQQQQDLDIIRQLSQRDSVVRAHEQAHGSVGGQYAGAAQYSYQRGPNGVNYAVGGEVPIDVSAINGNPQATLTKMQIVQRAALAPADPSSQDRRVAALASQQATQARAEIVSESRATNSSSNSDSKDSQLNSDPIRETSNISVAAPISAEIESSQVFNDRIAKINEILLAISQNDVSKATGQLLNDVV